MTPARPDSSSADFSDYGRLLRRRWGLIALGLVIGLAAAIGYLHAKSPTYESTASILVTPTGVLDDTNLANSRTNGSVNLDTESQLMTSSIVVERAKALLGSPMATGDLRAKIRVTVPPNSEILQITFSAASESGAQKGADAFAQAYLANRQVTAQSSLQGQVRSLEGSRATLTARLQLVSGQVATSVASSPDHTYAQQQQQLLAGQIASINTTLSRLSAISVTPGQVVTPSSLPTAPSSPNRLLVIGSGLLAGIVLGLVLAVVRDRTDRRVRVARDVERLLSLPLIAQIDETPKSKRASTVASASATSDAVRRLVDTVGARIDDDGYTLLIAGGGPGTSAGELAAEIALVLAGFGESTLLLSIDSSSPLGRNTMHADTRNGLADVVSRGTDIAAALPAVVLHARSEPSLSVVLAGADTRNLGTSLSRDAVVGLMHTMRGRYRYVVIDAGAVGSGHLVQRFAMAADATIITADLGSSRRDLLLDAVEQLNRISARVLGVVTMPAARKRRAGSPDVMLRPERTDVSRQANPSRTPTPAMPVTGGASAAVPMSDTPAVGRGSSSPDSRPAITAQQ